jgi:hypothetical protein
MKLKETKQGFHHHFFSMKQMAAKHSRNNQCPI